jgi:metal-responsive CopG/Arc/MetJ family transcriptional regulator
MAEVAVSERAPQVTFRLPAVAAVDRVAAREGRTRSQVIRSAVEELLDRRGETWRR